MDWWGYSHTGITGTIGTILVACNTAGGCGTAYSISSTSVSSNILTVTMASAAACPFVIGQFLQLSGLTSKTFLNGQLTVATPCGTGTSWTAAYTHSGYTSTADNGTVSYGQFMPSGKAHQSVVSGAGVVTITMATAKDCPFLTGQIVQPNNFADGSGDSQVLNGTSLTVLSPGCNGGASFTATTTAGAYTMVTENSGSVTATCGNGSANCAPVGGPFSSSLPSPYNIGTISVAANGTTVTASGLANWSTAMIGGWFISQCAPSCTIGSMTSQVVSRIVGESGGNTLTLEAPWSGTTQSGANYLIYFPNMPAVLFDGATGNSENNNAFGHVFRDFAIDCNGVLACIGYLTNQTQERSEYNDFQVSQQLQQTAISASGGACGAWGDGVLVPRGHWHTSGGIECDMNNNPGMAGYSIGGMAHAAGLVTDGWVIETFNQLAGKYNAGPAFFDGGTVEGQSGNQWQDAMWVDTVWSNFIDLHCEYYLNDCINIFGTSAAPAHFSWGNTFLGINAANNGSTNSVIELQSGTAANALISTMTDNFNSCLVKDDNLATACVQTGSSQNSPSQVLSIYSQNNPVVVNTTSVTQNNPTINTDVLLMDMPLQQAYLNTVGKTFLIKGAGVLSSTGGTSPKVTITAKLCSVSGCATGTVTPLAAIQSQALSSTAIANATWSYSVTAITVGNGTSCNFIVKGDPGLTIETGSSTSAADSVYTDSNTSVSSPYQNCANALFLRFFCAAIGRWKLELL